MKKYRTKETWKCYNSTFVRYYVVQKRYFIFWITISDLYDTELEARRVINFLKWENKI